MEVQQEMESCLQEAVQDLSAQFIKQMEEVKQLTAVYAERGRMPSVESVMDMRHEIIELRQSLTSLKTLCYQYYAGISGNIAPAGDEMESVEAESDNASWDSILLESEIVGDDAAGAEDDSPIADDLADLKLT